MLELEINTVSISLQQLRRNMELGAKALVTAVEDPLKKRGGRHAQVGVNKEAHSWGCFPRLLQLKYTPSFLPSSHVEVVGAYARGGDGPRLQNGLDLRLCHEFGQVV